MTEPPASRRPYDAARRRERAAAEREFTKRKVVEAARRLFAERGYVATTVTDIADEAGVALQSVYKAGGSKAELLHLAADLAVAGDHARMRMVDRLDAAGIGDEPDLERQVVLLARFVARTLDQALPLLVAEREAAVVDPGASAHLSAARHGRLDTFRGITARLAIDRGSVDEVATSLWAVASPEVFLLLHQTLGWRRASYERWLRSVLPGIVAPFL
jgi:AcrR family transcriptional regulator